MIIKFILLEKFTDYLSCSGDHRLAAGDRTVPLGTGLGGTQSRNQSIYWTHEHNLGTNLYTGHMNTI